MSEEKIVQYRSLPKVIFRVREQGKLVIYIDGVFDIRHEGYDEYVELARGLGHTLVVGVKPDDLASLKGVDVPYNTQAKRVKQMASYESVDVVTALPPLGNYSIPEYRIKVFSHLLPSAYAIMSRDAYLKEKKACVAAVPGISLLLLVGNPKTTSSTELRRIIR